MARRITPQSAAARSPAPEFAALQPRDEFQAANAHIYPTPESLRWAMRRYRTALEAAGAVVRINRREYVEPSKFAAVILQQASRRNAS